MVPALVAKRMPFITNVRPAHRRSERPGELSLYVVAKDPMQKAARTAPELEIVPQRNLPHSSTGQTRPEA
jgi:hypothetical protein